jgi:hypothetical protein
MTRTNIIFSFFGLVILWSFSLPSFAQFQPEDERQILSQASYGQRLGKRLLSHRDALNDMGRKFIAQSYGEEKPERIRALSQEMLDELSKALLSISRSQNYLEVRELPRASAYRKLSGIFQEAAADFIANASSPAVPNGRDQTLRETQRIVERTEILLNAIEKYAKAVDKLHSEWDFKSRRGEDTDGVFLFVNDLDVIQSQMTHSLKNSAPGAYLEEISNVQRASEFWLVVIPFLRSKIQSEKNSEKRDLVIQNQALVLNMFLKEWVVLDDLGMEVDPLGSVYKSISKAFHESQVLIAARPSNSRQIREASIRLANQMRRNGSSFGDGEIYAALSDIYFEVLTCVENMNASRVNSEDRSQKIQDTANSIRRSRSSQ